MTRFYFHVHDGAHTFLDDGGLDLPDQAAALTEAARGAALPAARARAPRARRRPQERRMSRAEIR